MASSSCSRTGAQASRARPRSPVSPATRAVSAVRDLAGRLGRAPRHVVARAVGAVERGEVGRRARRAARRAPGSDSTAVGRGELGAVGADERRRAGPAPRSDELAAAAPGHRRRNRPRGQPGSSARSASASAVVAAACSVRRVGRPAGPRVRRARLSCTARASAGWSPRAAADLLVELGGCARRCSTVVVSSAHRDPAYVALVGEGLGAPPRPLRAARRASAARRSRERSLRPALARPLDGRRRARRRAPWPRPAAGGLRARRLGLAHAQVEGVLEGLGVVDRLLGRALGGGVGVASGRAGPGGGGRRSRRPGSRRRRRAPPRARPPSPRSGARAGRAGARARRAAGRPRPCGRRSPGELGPRRAASRVSRRRRRGPARPRPRRRQRRARPRRRPGPRASRRSCAGPAGVALGLGQLVVAPERRQDVAPRRR